MTKEEVFKEAVKKTFLPRIRTMIEKESKHLSNLKKNQKKSQLIEAFIDTSEKHLEFLSRRLEEYTEYCTKK